MPESYIPPREADLVNWSANFDSKINATPAAYGLTVAQGSAYTTLHTNFFTAYATALDPNTRSPANIQAKNIAKDNLVNGPGGIRKLVKIVQAYPALTNVQRSELRITIPDTEPTPVPPPEFAPNLSIVSTLGRVVKVKLRDAKDENNRGMPEGVDGATVLSFVGEEMPENPLDWSFMENTTRTTLDLSFPATVPAGSQVWITAFWFNQRKETGPPAVAVSTRIADAVAQAA